MDKKQITFRRRLMMLVDTIKGYWDNAIGWRNDIGWKNN